LCDRDPAVPRGDELFDHPSAMRWQPVPHHQGLAGQVAQQMAQEVGDLRRTDGAAIEAISPSKPSTRL
jgi:hypothetical protein